MLSKTLFPCFVNAVTKNFALNILTSQSKTLNNVDFVRYAARKGTRARKAALLRANKLKKQSQPAPIPRYLQRKVKVSPELERVRCTDENWLETQPIDDVYNMKLYRGKPYTFAEAVTMQKELHDPSMLDNPKALIYANIELDLKLKKKDRFMEDLNGIITYPNAFHMDHKNRIVVICKEPEDQTKATDAGALYVGSTTLIKQILAGTISKEDFDYVVCHPDSYKELSSLRGILARKYPSTYNGLLRLDVDAAVKSFINGVEYKLKRSSIEPDFGWVDIPFGRLNMPMDELEANLVTALESVEKQKPQGTDDILFVIRVHLTCNKSRERFKIPHWKFLKNYPENGILIEEQEENSDEVSQKETQ